MRRRPFWSTPNSSTVRSSCTVGRAALCPSGLLPVARSTLGRADTDPPRSVPNLGLECSQAIPLMKPGRPLHGDREHTLTPQEIRQFLQDCVVHDDSRDAGLDKDAFYGLYVSWCCLNRKIPVPDHAFRTALRLAGLRPERNGKRIQFQGLRMTGPAATDYILNSSP
jgi:hypothetical protein